MAFTFKLMMEHKALNGYGLPLEGVSTPDKHTVTISFSHPAYRLLFYAAGQIYIVPEHIWSDVEDVKTFANANPVGTGPYVFKSFSPQNYVVKKNPNYWAQGKPSVDQFRFVSYSGNQAALRAMLAGKLDWASMYVPDIEKTWGSKGKHNAWANYPQMIVNLVPNNVRGPTADAAVRRAIYYGINREQIDKLGYTGQAQPTTPTQVMLPRGKKWIAEDLQGVRPQRDVAKAKQILEDAGYTMGSDGIYRDPQGTKLVIETMVVSGYTDQISALQVIEDNLADVGIKIVPTKTSYGSFSTAQKKGKFEMFITNLWGGPSPYYRYNNFFNSANTAPIGEKSSTNWARFRSDVVDKALATIAGTNDEEKLQRAYAKIQHVLMEEMPYIPLVESPSTALFRTDEATGWPTKDNPYAIGLLYTHPNVGVIAANLETTG